MWGVVWVDVIVSYVVSVHIEYNYMDFDIKLEHNQQWLVHFKNRTEQATAQPGMACLLSHG